MSLSDKRQVIFLNDDETIYKYKHEDVKEFIRKLQEDLQDFGDAEWIHRKIKKHFGEELCK